MGAVPSGASPFSQRLPETILCAYEAEAGPDAVRERVDPGMKGQHEEIPH